MRNISSALTAITLLLGSCFPIATATTISTVEPVAQIQVVLVNGTAADAPTIEQLEVKRTGGVTEPGRVGMQLFKDDEITTGSGVETSLLFDSSDSEDQIQVQMQEGSHARVGSLWAYVGRFLISGWGSFDTRTQDVRLGKRKTEFFLEVSEDGAVDVKVLRGEVEIEPIEGNQPPQEYSHAVSVQKLTLKALEGVNIQKGQRPTAGRQLATAEVETVLTKTDKLMVASLGATTPANVVPTSYRLTPEIANDPQRKKLAATAAFTRARHAATLTDSADSVTSLADAYKDLGAGKRAAKEYEYAGNLKPALQNSVTYLSGFAEAYRLAGNLRKADEKSKEALAKSEKPEATPFEKQLALNTRSNVVYDVALQYVGAAEWSSANKYFAESKSFLLSAKFKPTPTDDPIRVITQSNLNNTLLAIDRGDTSVVNSTRTGLSRFMGTYRGLVKLPGAKLAVPATVSINGNRFSLIQCNRTITGSILVRSNTAGRLLFDLVLDASNPIKKISLTATLLAKDRIELASAPSETYAFSFSTSLKQEPLACLQLYNPQ